MRPVSFQVIRNEQSKAAAVNYLRNLRVSEDCPLQVVIDKYSPNRSLEQNNTLWWWYGIFSQDDPAARSPAEIHDHCKRHFLIPILEASNEAYREKLEELRELYRNGEQKAAELAFDYILWLTSTTQLKAAQMADFMAKVQEYALTFGIVLPEPDPKMKR